MNLDEYARSTAWRQGKRAHQKQRGALQSIHSSHKEITMSQHHEQPAELLIPEPPVALAVRKCGRRCIVAKLVVAEPFGDLCLAIPYRNRAALAGVVSIPISVVNVARRAGARFLVVRYDERHECRCGPLVDSIQAYGTIRTDHGVSEIFIPTDRLKRTIWHDWPYARRVVEIPVELESEDSPAFVRPVAVQMGLFESVAA